MNKKYYDGLNVIDILFKNLEPRKMLKVLNAFADSDGVDAVEVIRCEDCKWHINGGFCDLYFADRAADEYCSRAERKEEWTG